MNAFGEGIVTIALAIVGLGVVATLVGSNAQTSNVLKAGFGGLATGITAAEGPVLGGGGVSTSLGSYSTSLGSAFGS